MKEINKFDNEERIWKLGSIRREIITEIINEMARQDLKWGLQRHTSGEWVLILNEELGEASKSILEESSDDKINKELLQVAAVMIQWIADRKSINI